MFFTKDPNSEKKCFFFSGGGWRGGGGGRGWGEVAGEGASVSELF